MAVAIREAGYTNVKIFNGGIKEWMSSGKEIEIIDPLPDDPTHLWSAEILYQELQRVEQEDCRNKNGDFLLTLLDLRISRIPEGGEAPLVIDTVCPSVNVTLDDLQKENVRELLSTDFPVLVITETGNRDEYAARYLAKFGYDNVYGLRFGMRGWIKHNFPTRFLKNEE